MACTSKHFLTFGITPIYKDLYWNFTGLYMYFSFHPLLEQRSERMLQKVKCKHGHVVDRDIFQHWLSTSNPQWKEYTERLERTGDQPRTNPDGDVSTQSYALAIVLTWIQVALDGVAYDNFVVPDCPSCLLEDRRNSNVRLQVPLRRS